MDISYSLIHSLTITKIPSLPSFFPSGCPLHPLLGAMPQATISLPNPDTLSTPKGPECSLIRCPLFLRGSSSLSLGSEVLNKLLLLLTLQLPRTQDCGLFSAHFEEMPRWLENPDILKTWLATMTLLNLRPQRVCSTPTKESQGTLLSRKDT